MHITMELEEAIVRNDYSAVEKNLAKSSTDSNSCLNIVHLAISKGDYTTAEIVINSNRCNIDDNFDADGYTPLILATIMSKSDIVGLLISKKVSLDRQCISEPYVGYTALHFATADLTAEKIAEMLIAAGASLEIKNEQGETPLHIAAKRGNVDVGENLLINKANVNVTAKSGITPLMMACIMPHFPFVSMLAQAPGINVNAADDMGDTALHYSFMCQLQRAFLPDGIEVSHEHEAVAYRLVRVFPNLDLNKKSKDGHNGIKFASPDMQTILKGVHRSPHKYPDTLNELLESTRHSDLSNAVRNINSGRSSTPSAAAGCPFMKKRGDTPASPNVAKSTGKCPIPHHDKIGFLLDKTFWIYLLILVAAVVIARKV
jgi:ankyrin repeat protein